MGRFDTVEKMAVSGVTGSIKKKNTLIDGESQTRLANVLTQSLKTDGEGGRARVSSRKGPKFGFKWLSRKTPDGLFMTQMHALIRTNRSEGMDWEFQKLIHRPYFQSWN